MSAADLFRDGNDVDFRLRGTHLVIGRRPYYVHGVNLHPVLRHNVLNMEDENGDVVNVEIGRLPLSAMTNCPYGYYSGLFYARGPARHRYQGITGSSLWAILPSGGIDPGGVGNPRKVLQELVRQPLTRRVGKNASGVLTRDVYIGNNNQVLIRGRYRGIHIGDNIVEPVGVVTPLMEKLLAKARLKLKDNACYAPKEYSSNPCSEIIL